MKMYFQNYSNNLFTYRLLLLCLLVFLVSCKQSVDDARHDIIAIYDDDELSRAELEHFLPQGISALDSAGFAKTYIDEWIQMRAIISQARESIPDLEEKIQYKLKSYEGQLITYEYAEWLISPTRMDTVVPEAEIREYYEQFPEKFVSRGNYFQYFHIMTEKRNQYRAVTLMRSENPAQIEELLEWAKENATEYRLDSTFVGDMELERIGQGYNHGNIKRQRLGLIYPYQNKLDGKQFFNYLKMIKIIRAGDQLPLDLCRERIRMIKLNEKKNKIIENAADRLVEAAKSTGKVKILR